MEQKNKMGTTGIIQRILGAALAAAAVSVAAAWWRMPYLHHDWYGNDLNVILHIVTFALCPVLCALTFLFAEKNRKLCVLGGAAVLVLAVLSTLVNDGFVPYGGTLAVGFIAVLYLLTSFLASRPEKPEKDAPEVLVRKFRSSRAAAVISGVVAAFAIVFPKKAEVFSQHMTEDGPGVIEYYYQYTDFGIILMVVIPVSLILLVVFAVRAGLLRGRMKKVSKPGDEN